MRGYFVNPEFKKSSAALVIVMAAFFLLTLSVMKLQHDSMKDDYAKTLGAVAAKVSEISPETGREIMPFITKKLTEEEALKGQAFLKQYGLDRSLEDSLFPYVNSTIAGSIRTIAVIFTLMTAVLFILNCLQHGFFYHRIRRLTLGARKVVDGNYGISICEDSEGDLSKLVLSFNSMRQVIRSYISDLEKEKMFLVDLLSDLSHQLKTPLSSMIIYNDIMLNKELTVQQRKSFLVSNQNQLNRMNLLVKNILKLARLDAKAIELSREKQSLNDTVQEAIDSLESKASEGKVKMSFSEEEEVLFPHDRLWLEEALINIIKNCIEHTPPAGEIHITLSENPVFSRVVIEDNGEGIREEDLPNIFKRFYRGKSSGKNDSAGIGLALAKAIIELHEGTIEARSRLGEGTSFTVTFLKI